MDRWNGVDLLCLVAVTKQKNNKLLLQCGGYAQRVAATITVSNLCILLQINRYVILINILFEHSFLSSNNMFTICSVDGLF